MVNSRIYMPTSIQDEIAQLTKRLEHLQEQAEDVIREKLKEARQVVTELEFQLSEITGRPSATMVRASDHKRWAPITDEQLEVQILFVVQKTGDEGVNATEIARQLKQDPVRIRLWIKKHSTVLKRVGAGPGTRFYLP